MSCKPEMKYQTAKGTVNVNQSWQDWNLSAKSVGDDSNQRNGKQIQLVKWNGNFDFKLNTAATMTTFRVMLILDKGANGANASTVMSLTLEDPSDLWSQYNAINMGKRILVLKDFYVSICDSGTKEKVKRPKLKRIPFSVKYNGTGGTEAAVAQNSLWLMIRSNESTNPGELNFSHRIYYHDC